MKRRRILTIFVILVALCLSGCKTTSVENKKLSIVCTNFPAYDWVNQIIYENTENYEVTLLGGGGDIHSYQPLAKDIAMIQSCDLFIYVGGASDVWAEEVVEVNNINSLKLAETVEDELLCADEDHNHHNHKNEDFDEHIWLSLKNAEKMVDAICRKITELDSEHAALYTANNESYKQKLSVLDDKYCRTVESSSDKTMIFADRFPFLYMTKDYGIKYVAAFSGCSADTDAGFQVIAKLSMAVDELGKDTILILENSGLSVAETVIENTKNKNAKTAVMNSCQSIGQQEIQSGVSYLEIMEKNLESLNLALQ